MRKQGSQEISEKNQDDKENGKIHHPCQKYLGQDSNCTQCRIRLHEGAPVENNDLKTISDRNDQHNFGYCLDWCNTIPKLYKRIKSKNYNLFNDEEIEEIIANVFTSIFDGIENFKAESKFSTWAGSICNNKRIDFIGKKMSSSGYIDTKIPFIPDGLIHICNQNADQLALYTNTRCGQLKLNTNKDKFIKVICEELLTISERPSWHKIIKRLKEKKSITLYNSQFIPYIQKCCLKFQQLLFFQSLKPSGTLYIISRIIKDEVIDELYHLSQDYEWRQSISNFIKKYEATNGIITLPHKHSKLKEDEDNNVEIEITNPTPSNIDEVEIRLTIEKLIQEIEQIDKKCAEIFTEYLQIERHKKTNAPGKQGRIKDEAHRQQWSRCLKKMFKHPDNTKDLIIPGDLVLVSKVESVPQNGNNFIWCILKNGTRIRSDKKLDAAQTKTVLALLEKGKPVRITGVKASSCGNQYFPVYEIPEERDD